jgi:MFS family permease
LVAESWLNERAEHASRGRLFGAYLVVSWGRSATGPMLLNMVQASSSAFIMVGLALASSLIPMGLTQQPNPEIRRSAPLSLIGLYRISPVGLVLCVTSGLVNSSFYAMVPVYLERTGYGPVVVTRFLALALLAGLLVQYPVGVLSDRRGRGPVTLGLLFTGFSFAVILNMASGVTVPLLGAIGCAFAGMTAPLYGLGSGQSNDRLQDGNYVAASGGLLFAWSLGSTAGPGFAGWIMGSVGPSGLFAYIVFLLGCVTLFAGMRMLLRDEVPRELRTAFVPAAAAPPRLTELAAGKPPQRESVAALTETSNPGT